MVINKGPFLEWLRMTIVEIGANTFTEVEQRTPVSKTEKLAMLIHRVELEIGGEFEMNDGDEVNIQLADEHQVAEITISNAHLVAKSGFRADGAAAGAVVNTPYVIVFEPPQLYSKSSIFLGGNGLSQTNPLVYDGRIGYTLEKVDSDAYIAALVQY